MTEKQPPPSAGFKELWKIHYGQDISDEQAEACEERIVAFVGLVMRIGSGHRERPPP